MSDQYLSARKMEQVCVLDLVEAALDALVGTVEQIEDTTRRSQAALLATRVAMYKTKARVLVDKRELDEWPSKDLRRYSRAIRNLQDKVRASWPGETVNAVEFLAAIITQVAIIDENLPRTNQYIPHRLEWGKLHAMMQELYSMFDPDGTRHAEVERGGELGVQMRAVVRGEVA